MKSFYFLVVAFLFGMLQVYAIPLKPSIKSTTRFIENKQQWDREVVAMADFAGYRMYITNNDWRIAFYDTKAVETVHQLSDHVETVEKAMASPIPCHAVFMHFVNQSKAVTWAFEQQLSTTFNYFIGQDYSKWASNVHAYETLLEQNVYPSIDVRISGANSNLKYDWIVHPNANPDQIKIVYEGANAISLSEGKLHIKTSITDYLEAIPSAYQLDAQGLRHEVACEYRLVNGVVQYAFPNGYDRSSTLIIDPVLVIGTYSGSSGMTFGFTATYDQLGDLIVGGECFGIGFPTTPGAYDLTFNSGVDFAINKYNPTGNQQIYGTYIGGSGSDNPRSLISDNSNNLYILGNTGSTNFPTTPGAYDLTFNGGTDLTVSVLNPTGSTLISSTYVGGSSADGTNTIGFIGDDFNRGEINLDGNGDILVASCTNSSNFPVTSGSLKTTLSGLSDGIAFKMNSGLTAMAWSTYIGGSGNDNAMSITTDNFNNVFVTGGTESSNFFIQPSSFNNSYNGQADGYLYKISTNGTQLLASTFLIDDITNDQGYFVDVDPLNNVYVMGLNYTAIIPSPGVYNNPGTHQFIMQFNNSLQTQNWKTTLGANSTYYDMMPTAFLVDNCRNIYLCGHTGTTNLPVTANAFQSAIAGSDDFYLIALTANATGLSYATYFGGSSLDHVDGGTSRFDKRGVVYEGVCSGSMNMPLSTNAFGTSLLAGWDVYGFKFDFQSNSVSAAGFVAPNDTGCTPMIVNFNNFSTNSISYSWDFGDGTPIDTNAAPSHTFLNPGNYTVTFVAHNPNACNLTDTALLHILVLPTTAATAQFSMSTNCILHQVAFTNQSSGSTNFVWDFGDGSPTTTIASPVHVYTGNGPYTISLIANNPCGSPDTTSQTIQFSFVTAQTNLLVNDTGCAPIQVSVSNLSTNATTYSWDFGDGSPLSNATTPNHLYTNPGTYQIQLIAFNPATCNGSDTVTMNMIVLPTTLAIADFSYTLNCVNNAVSLLNQSVNAIAYHWDFGDGATSTQSNPTHAYPAHGPYTITLIAYQACGFNDTVQKQVYFEYVKAGFSSMVSVCVPASFMGTDTSHNATAIQWSFGDGSYASATYVQHVFNQVGSFQIQLIASNPATCNSTDTARLNITVYPNPIAEFNPEYTNENGSMSFYFQNLSSGASVFDWSFGDGAHSASIDVYHTFGLHNDYVVCLKAISPQGCIDTTCHEIVAIPHIGIPNAFSPNGDNLDDVFKVLCDKPEMIVSYHLQIFNRWGERVFESTDYNFGWNGYYKELLQPISVFVYVADVRFENSKWDFHQKGDVTLIR